MFILLDVMFDAVLHNLNSDKVKAFQSEKHKYTEDYIVATIHRAENTDNPEKLKDIFDL